MKAINEEFDRYVLSLNELITSESRAKLHNFYIMHKSDLKSFKQVDDTISQLLKEELLLMDSVDKLLTILAPAMPLLSKMRQTIETLSTDEICSEVQPKLNSHIKYIQNSMPIEGVVPAHDQFNELLHLNKTTIAEKNKQEKDATRKAEQERKRKEDREHEKEMLRQQRELEEKKAQTEKLKADTYQQYIDMGIMSPEIVEELEFGDTLQKIEQKAGKKESELPPVEDEKQEHEKALKRIEHDFSNRVKIMSDELSTSITSKHLACKKLSNKMSTALSLCILIVPIVIALPLWFKYRSERNVLLSEIKSMNYTIQYLNSRAQM